MESMERKIRVFCFSHHFCVEPSKKNKVIAYFVCYKFQPVYICIQGIVLAYKSNKSAITTKQVISSAIPSLLMINSRSKTMAVKVEIIYCGLISFNLGLLHLEFSVANVNRTEVNRERKEGMKWHLLWIQWANYDSEDAVHKTGDPKIYEWSKQGSSHCRHTIICLQ